MRKALLLLSAFALSTPSFAVSAKDLVVGHADLDLESEHGQKTLERRIAQAARSFCKAQATRTGTRIRHQDENRCIANATKLANEQMAALIAQQVRRGG